MKIIAANAIYVQRGDLFYLKKLNLIEGVYMKIITDNATYVQRNDIAYLNQTDFKIPASIFLKTYQAGIHYTDDTNRYEFVKFDQPNEIEFFKKMDWILDYNQVKNLAVDDLFLLELQWTEEMDRIAINFNHMSKAQQAQHQDMITRYNLLEFRSLSLEDYIRFREGNLEMSLPEEVSKEESILDNIPFWKPVKKNSQKPRVLRLEKAIRSKK